jgi:hypothetical protein
MNVLLEKAAVPDVPVLFTMQGAAFSPLLEKYQDKMGFSKIGEIQN